MKTYMRVRERPICRLLHSNTVTKVFLNSIYQYKNIVVPVHHCVLMLCAHKKISFGFYTVATWFKI